MIRFVRVAAGHYRVETENGYHLADIRDTKRGRTETVMVGGKWKRLHFGRWQTTNVSGAGIGWGERTLAEAKARCLAHWSQVPRG